MWSIATAGSNPALSAVALSAGTHWVSRVERLEKDGAGDRGHLRAGAYYVVATTFALSRAATRSWTLEDLRLAHGAHSDPAQSVDLTSQRFEVQTPLPAPGGEQCLPSGPPKAGSTPALHVAVT